MRTMLLITTALALAPAGLAAQAAEGSGSGQARIEAAMQAAARAEIPASLLESKVNEGRAKGVAEARIASAVESRLEALVQARDVLGHAMREAEIEAVTAGELSVAADALQAGVSEEALVEVTREAPAERRAVATVVLTSLVQLGVVSEQAEVRVQQALSRGAEALANLRAEVAAQLRLRGGPGIGGLGLGASGAAAGGGAGGGLIHLN